MIRFLHDTDQPAIKYIAKAYLLSFIPAMIIGTIITTIVVSGGPKFKGDPIFLFIGVVLFSPVTETLLMWPIITLLSLKIKSELWIAISSALIWGILHSLMAPIWGLVVAWPFFVMSTAFIQYRKKSIYQALAVTMSIHICHNFLPGLAIITKA